MAQILGIDAGSSAIKAAVISAETNALVATGLSPSNGVEALISRPLESFAEQSPVDWWKDLVLATRQALKAPGVVADEVKAIGIAYQMHGLVLVDKAGEVIRPAIIWCDSRAVEIGVELFEKLGRQWCLENLLNSPGNFTFSKLAWVKRYEPENFAKIYKVMLPGDYLAYRLTGEIKTSIPGLSEGMFWNIKERTIANKLFKAFDISTELLPDIVDTFAIQGTLSKEAAAELGLKAGIPITYRSGDQPNNALSLKVLNSGDVAATAGTSAVIYGVTNKSQYDQESRVNTFVHVNDRVNQVSNGVLLCVNGAGSAYGWLRQTISANTLSYLEMDNIAACSSIGANGVTFLPFGNGSERMLANRMIGSSLDGISFGRDKADIFRAGLEGVAFAMNYGLEVMRASGVSPEIIRAGDANMFKSSLFREIFCCVTGVTLELYNTDGAQGAARGAGFGAGIYKYLDDAFDGLKVVSKIEPETSKLSSYATAYSSWLKILNSKLDL